MATTGEVEGSHIPRNHALETAVDLAAGTVGGVANCLSGQPLDTVKVKMQTFPTLYRNAFHCFVQTYKTDGFFHGLYAGTVPALAANIAENAILFMFYGICQKSVMKLVHVEKENDLKAIHKAFAGGGAAFFASLALCPTELIKCKLQAMREMVDQGKLEKSKTFSGPYALTKHICKTEGVRGMFRGLGPTLGREMPGYFVFFGGYEISRNYFTPPGKTPDDIGPLKTVLCGGIGGVSLWVAIFPTDVVKSRIQISEGKSATFAGTFMQVVREDGVLALYRGLGPTVVRTFIASGALFLSYEYCKRGLEYLLKNQ
ncbi:mitochondrial ornithine transporter 1-like [Lineus longissimus]|uniref:mitochondrial ornithine transporter 1-like n=1 Tax=Lineus longissimus TaxID=88925 RepID=UPI002B4F6F07